MYHNPFVYLPLCILISCSWAFADITVELVPHTSGPYELEQTISVDVRLTLTAGQQTQLRWAELCFADTSPTLEVLPILPWIPPFYVHTFDPVSGCHQLTWPGPLPFPGIMELIPGDPLTIFTIDVVVHGSGTLSAFPMGVGGGFGITPDDPIWACWSETGCLNGAGLPMVLSYGADGAIDLADYFNFQECMTAPGVLIGSECEAADLDHDFDVDLRDFALFQQQFTGS